MNAPPHRRWPWLLAFAVPIVPSIILCAAIRSDPAAALAPFLGPWGGLSVGHSDCTMAHAMPLASWIAAGLGVALPLALLRSRQRGTRRVLGIAIWLWVCLWCVAALLSIVNSTS